MNKEQLLERITSLEAEAKHLREILEALEKEERWRADRANKYWFVGRQGEVINGTDWNESPDIKSYNTFNYFQTKEEAERIARVQLAYRKLDWAIRQFDTVQDAICGFVFYIDNTGALTTVHTANHHSPLLRIKNRSDAQYILSNYKAEILTFLTGGEK